MMRRHACLGAAGLREVRELVFEERREQVLGEGAAARGVEGGKVMVEVAGGMSLMFLRLALMIHCRWNRPA